MKKQLSEMTLKELWQLFPIILTEHNPEWTKWYDEEYKNLRSVLPELQIVRISHIGSTAINSIMAKPIIDIMVEVSQDSKFTSIKKILEKCGYICMSENEERLSFNKGYTIDGFAEKVFHLHLRYEGDHDELYFRDYLNENSDIAKKYEQLKMGLWKKYEHDRDAYSERKTEFVRKYTEIAKATMLNKQSTVSGKVFTEMRRIDRKLTETEAIEILERCEYGILSTIGEDGYPYGVPVSYVMSSNKIYLHAAKGVGKKFTNIQNNPKVCFTVVGNTEVLPSQFGTKYESVIIFGEAKVLQDKCSALEKMVEKYSMEYKEAGAKYIDAAMDKVDIYEITIEFISGKARR